MFKRYLFGVIALSLIFTAQNAFANRFGERYCNQSGYHCITIKENDSWQSLFHSEHERDIVQRINRINTRLHPGMRIAVPNNRAASIIDISPLPTKIAAPGVKTIIVDQNDLAWGAYDAQGDMVRWGPTSSGKSFCADIGHSCRTVHGEFTVYTKKGGDCFSSKFPVGKGGAKMPYCMFFQGGYALHGSYEVPGYNASHGCVRLFISDAEWLNRSFVDVGSTRVVVRAINPETEPKFVANPRPAAKKPVVKSGRQVQPSSAGSQGRYSRGAYGLY